MKTRYLYLKRDTGLAPYSVASEPTPTDHACVRFGLLEIVRLTDLARLTPEGKWLPLRAGVLTDFSESEFEKALTHVHPGDLDRN